MNTHSDEFQDILGAEGSDDVRPVLDRLALMAAAASLVKAPPAVDHAVLAAIRDARLGRGSAGLSLPRGSEATPAYPRARLRPVPGNERAGRRRLGSHAGAVIAAGFAVAAVALAVGLFGLHPAQAPAVSARAVLARALRANLGPTQAASLHYRIVLTDRQHPRSHQTGAADIWIRGSHAGIPETVRENMSILPRNRSGECILLQYALVGNWAYSTPYWNCAGGPMIPFSAMMEPFDGQFPSTATVLPANLFYGVAAARLLRGELPGNVSLGHRSLQGHRVDVIGVRKWPGQPRLSAVLYYDARTSVLRGFDALIKTTWGAIQQYKLRLVRGRIGPASGVPTARFSLPPNVYYRGSSRQRKTWPIALDVQVSRQKLQRVCPGIRRLDLLLNRGTGPLRACRTAIPTMSAPRLASLLMGSRPYALLHTAVRSHVFTRALADQSLRAERTSLARWVTWGSSLRWPPHGPRSWNPLF